MNDKLMNLVPKSVSGAFFRQALVAKKNSPHIFFGAGVLGVVTSTVLACRATLKLSSTLDDIQHDIDTVQELKQNDERSQYPVEEYHRDATYVYLKSGFMIFKLYGPSILIGIVSIGALTGSHVQLARRNAAVMAAYAALDQAYNEYRARVREQVGEEQELAIYRGGTRKELVKDEDGNNMQITRIGSGKGSPYAVDFDAGSIHWHKNPELNRLYIQCQEDYANKLLIVRGHVFLNEVYDMLDVERTQAGSVVGWVKDGDGDNFIDFGMYEAYNSDFNVGLERVVRLDFNVDGVIYDKI